MNRGHAKVIVVLLVLLSAPMLPRSGGAAFSNLDFESSAFSGAANSLSESADALFPSWTLRYGNLVQATGSWNINLLAGPVAALYTTGPNVLQGQKSVLLASWLDVPVSLSQAGDVPAGTRSLRFVARNIAYTQQPLPPGPFDLQLNAQSVPVVTLSQNGGDFAMGADVTAWAATNAEMRLGIPALSGSNMPGFAFFDAISFSPVPIPEPAAGMILGSTAMVLLAGARHSRFRRRDTSE